MGIYEISSCGLYQLPRSCPFVLVCINLSFKPLAHSHSMKIFHVTPYLNLARPRAAYAVT